MDLLGSLGSDQAGPDEPQCSRKSCRADAAWQIRWNNPKVHQPERRKIWLACDEHREWLEGFLRQRLFWRSTDPIDTDPRQADEQNRAGE
ncbi:MAG: acetone carboxylase [Nesterenkonia sp.]